MKKIFRVIDIRTGEDVTNDVLYTEFVINLEGTLIQIFDPRIGYLHLKSPTENYKLELVND